ncbi:MAG: UDP-N-acetylmuramate--L-alanine ligase [Acidobacteriota bacterium]|nr:MAG: UDP-N-acetylmuramate--L-alanine ligase [Acidobacteriota bacterium]
MFKRTEHVHFVGVGGAGMSGIAEVLRNLGYRVSGCDLKASPATEHLQQIGCTVNLGHDARHVEDADVVVLSSAVPADNSEARAARRANVPVIPRAEMLAELMRMKYSVAVAGTHGKTNTTSMVASVLQAGGLDPTVVIGGRLRTLGSHARLGKGDFLVAEADESDGSFLLLTPTLAVVTNIDREHMDYYGSMDALRQAFLDFLNTVPFYGASVLCFDDDVVRALRPKATRRVLTYGFSEDADARAGDAKFEAFRSSYAASWRGKPLGRIALQMPGRHSIQNSLAAVTVGLDLGISFKTIRGALEGCPSADRRFELKGEAPSEKGGIMVVDDYGHHPTEIRATLRAAREGWPERRLVAVFQPHRYTRVRDLHKEFAHAFDDTAVVVVMPIYPAGEAPMEGVSAEKLSGEMKEAGHPSVHFTPGRDEAARALETLTREGDMVITLGAGDVWRVGEVFLKHLEGKAA